MKRYIINTFVILLFLVGCAGVQYQDFSQKAYKILNASKISYDTVTDSVIDLHKEGLISDDVYSEIEKYADIYADAQNGAVDAIKSYQMGLGSSEDVSAKLTAVSLALTRLISVATPYLVEE